MTDTQAAQEEAAEPAPAHVALARAIMELDEHAAQLGWDQPTRLFALVRTARALEENPQLASLLDERSRVEAEMDPHALMMIEQEVADDGADVAELLGSILWPEEVDGCALMVERLVLPPEAEAQAADMTDPQEREEFLLSHEKRDEVRMSVGVLRSGESWCALRARSHDTREETAQGSELVPGLVDALRATFA